MGLVWPSSRATEALRCGCEAGVASEGACPPSAGCTAFGARRVELLSPMMQRFTSGASAAKVAQSLST